ncbi:hypothetical protein BT96DRAFT_1016872 [Gymnopus androsaceus JB14]|uniref:DUF6593 domain-containing protein n=1 Tax=Gymnopus androsaceus JB14 TaxID=1447944 RepID=A0A6A4I2I7_9AGAR|nr:hypothetical protein BT96DRAFT_1016872 [Gymnopus androsaceus JB14]
MPPSHIRSSNYNSQLPKTLTMKLTFKDRKAPLDTKLYTDDGVALYHIHTPFLFHGTSTITKLDQRSHSYQMSNIELHALRSDSVTVGSQPVRGLSHSFTNRKVQFRGSDNYHYEWKNSSNGSMTLKSKWHSEVASYNPGNSGIFLSKRPATLRIQSQGVYIADEIVATFAYALKRWEKSNHDHHHHRGNIDLSENLN